MLRSTPEWEAFERDWIRQEPKGYLQNIRTVDAMVRYVEERGKSPLKRDPMIGIEDEIRLARMMNVRLQLR